MREDQLVTTNNAFYNVKRWKSHITRKISEAKGSERRCRMPLRSCANFKNPQASRGERTKDEDREGGPERSTSASASLSIYLFDRVSPSSASYNEVRSLSLQQAMIVIVILRRTRSKKRSLPLVCSSIPSIFILTSSS